MIKINGNDNSNDYHENNRIEKWYQINSGLNNKNKSDITNSNNRSKWVLITERAIGSIMEAIIKIITVIKMTYKTNRKEKKETFTWTRNWLGKNARKNLILKIT